MTDKISHLNKMKKSLITIIIKKIYYITNAKFLSQKKLKISK